MESAASKLKKYIELLIKNSSIINTISSDVYNMGLLPYIESLSEFENTPCIKLYQEVESKFKVLMSYFANEMVNLCLLQFNSPTRIANKGYVDKIHETAKLCCFALRYVNNLAMHAEIVSKIDSEYFNNYIKVDRCHTNSIYVETQVLDRLIEICKTNTTCNDSSSEEFCKMVTKFRDVKIHVENSYSDSTTTVGLLKRYNQIYMEFQTKYIKLMFKNIIKLFNDNTIQCMLTFLDQQIQLVIQNHYKIEEMERIANFRRPVVMEWLTD